MDKYIIEKQIFFVKYDMIRFDVIKITKSIQIISQLKSSDTSDVCKIINDLCKDIFEDNIKEILLIMNFLLKNDESYTTKKLISGLEIIKKSIMKKEKIYNRYADFVDSL